MKRALEAARRLARALAVMLGLGAAGALATSIPFIPPTSQYNEPSQLVATINTLIQQLQGATGYAPAQIMPLGSLCTISGASPGPLVCAGQRGVATFTAATVAGNANLSVSITNSLITAASLCNANIVAQPTAGAGATVASITPTAGTLTIVLTNATATTTGSVSLPVAFNCFN